MTLRCCCCNQTRCPVLFAVQNQSHNRALIFLCCTIAVEYQIVGVHANTILSGPSMDWRLVDVILGYHFLLFCGQFIAP